MKKNNLKQALDSIFQDDTSTGGETPSFSPEYISDESNTFQSTAFGRNTSSIYTLEPGHLCPHCKYGHVEEDISFNGTPCEFFVYCPVCNAHICTYKPMAHQAAFHQDTHQKKLYAGGFGSAKTYTCGMEFLTTVLQIPNSAGLMGAATWGQVSDTCLKFVCDNLPKALVARSNQDKVNWYIQLVNGSRISAKALNEEGKIRSMNLSIIWIEEASEVQYSVVAFLAARLRNKVGFYKGKNRLKMLLSSNPDVGWLNNDWLMCSDIIYYHGDVKDRYNVRAEKRDPAISTHISATSANVYLPPDYEANLAKNKEPWWINRYLKGSFKYTEGLVYPNFVDWFCDPFPIPDTWRRVTGTDFGRRDPTAHLVGALDPVNKVIYIYDEIEESLEDYPIDYMANKIKECNSYPPALLAFPHQCDPRGRNRDQVSGKSWIDSYRAHGIIFQPAHDCEGDSLAPTINKVYTYAKHGRLKIFKTCKKMYNSLSRYKYKERTLGDDKNQGEKPQDKNNHLPDALRYLLSPFPHFPEDPDSFESVWRELMIRTNKPKTYNYLSNDDVYDEYIVEFMDNFG
jgi:phage terminase large subunit